MERRWGLFSLWGPEAPVRARRPPTPATFRANGHTNTNGCGRLLTAEDVAALLAVPRTWGTWVYADARAAPAESARRPIRPLNERIAMREQQRVEVERE
jgi:hypothetical protein